MSEFAKTLQPHLEAHGITDLGVLARKLRDWRIHVHPRELERWMAGDVFQSTVVDAPAIGRVLGLSEEESYELFTAFHEDSGIAFDAWKQAGQKKEPAAYDPYRDRNQPDRRTKSMAGPGETREEVIEYLTKDYGMDQDEAEALTVDEGLWLLRPEMRFAIPDEEAEKQWKDAANFAQGLGDMFISAGLFNRATAQVMLDAAERAWEAQARARQRLEEKKAE
jgi:hypothetical protein